jgi:hypothetical protein
MKQGLRIWTGFVWPRLGPETDPCEYGNVIPGTIKYSDFLRKMCGLSFRKNNFLLHLFPVVKKIFSVC